MKTIEQMTTVEIEALMNSRIMSAVRMPIVIAAPVDLRAVIARLLAKKSPAADIAEKN